MTRPRIRAAGSSEAVESDRRGRERLPVELAVEHPAEISRVEVAGGFLEADPPGPLRPTQAGGPSAVALLRRVVGPEDDGAMRGVGGEEGTVGGKGVHGISVGL
jgi:hypothetical protein